MTDKRRYDRWTAERQARAAFLAGRGLTHADIGNDPAVDASGAAVQRQLSRVGLLTIGEARGDYAIRLPAALMATFEAAGRARQSTADKVFRDAVRALASDKGLLDNVLDDGVST